MNQVTGISFLRGALCALVVSGCVFGSAKQAHAISLSSALTPVSGNSSLGAFGAAAGAASTDSVNQNAYSLFSALSDGLVYNIGGFKANAGDTITATILSETACFHSRNNAILENSGGSYTKLLSGDKVAGDSNTLAITQEGTYSLGLISPDGRFSSDDSKNPNGVNQMNAIQITQAGSITFNFPNPELGLMAFTFNFMVGDIVIFNEDSTPISEESRFGRDGDWNDLIYIVRATSIPEPGTLLLLGSGLLLGGMRRRRLA